jgi:type I restriction enzyme S subunit
VQELRAGSAGSAQGVISRDDLSEIELPLAPSAEQRRIVAKIDSLSEKSKRARDRLDHVPRLVERYRDAILAAAFRGKLSDEIADIGKDENGRWSLPEDWRWVAFREVVRVASNLVPTNTIQNLPHIAPDNIERGTARLLPYRTIGEDQVISPKHHFRPGQIIYSKIRPYLRKAVLPDFEGACSADMYPLDASGAVHPKFLLYWMISNDLAQFASEHEGRTVLPKINQEALNRTPIPLPPVRTQEVIAHRIETAFAWIDRLACEAQSARKLIDRLDQAILSKAFRGELVPQDPNDEPASVLLERIRAERNGLAGGRKRRARAAA